MDKNKSSIQPELQAIEDIYKKLNTFLFKGELEPITLVIGTAPKKNVLGYFTVGNVWNEYDKDNNIVHTYHEICITSDFLHRPLDEIVATLVHEMVHLYCNQNDIQDVSRGGYYHNKHFKEVAEMVMLNVEKVPKIGFSKTSLSQGLKNWVDKNRDKYNVFDKERTNALNAPPKKKHSNNSIKYVCPECGAIARTTKEMRLICGECDVEMEKQI
jgi:ribosomal protein S27AE